jgi:hypothetical protein
MALIINKDNLKKSDGTVLPDTGIFVKFMMQSDFDSFNQKFFLRYYTKYEFKEEGYSTIDIIDLPNQFIKELDMQKVMYYEQLMNKMMPDATCFQKTFTTYHLFIKEYLEEFLGKDTVEIRPDLG